MPFTILQTDEFHLEAVDLGGVDKVIVGHTTVGRGKGWYCERVVVMETDDRQAVFPCNRWLDTGIDDREIERVLYPLAEVPIDSDASDDNKHQPKSRGVYKAFVTSGGGNGNYNSPNTNNSNNNDLYYMNTEYNDQLNCNNNAGDVSDLDIDGSVTIMVYGSEGEAGPIELNNGDSDMFTAGKQDEFDVSLSC